MKKLIMAFMVTAIIGCGSKEEATVSAATVQATAAGMTIESSESCVLSATVGGLNLIFGYKIVKYSTGDQLVTCGVANASFSTEHANLIRATQETIATSNCGLIMDVDANSFGLWTFTNTNGTKIATYKDEGGTYNNTSVVFTAASCTSY